MDNALYWRRNLFVCLFGSFTTLLAMTLLLPFLPIYVEQLGVTGHAAIVQWSGVAYGITFLGAALVAPLWGKFADLYGRKPILMRAALAMAICMSLIGMAQNIWQLVRAPAAGRAVGRLQLGCRRAGGDADAEGAIRLGARRAVDGDADRHPARPAAGRHPAGADRHPGDVSTSPAGSSSWRSWRPRSWCARIAARSGARSAMSRAMHGR